MMLLLYFLSPAKTWNLLNHISRTGCQVWGCTNQREVYVYTFIRSVEPYMYSHLYKGGSRIFPVGGCLFLLSINKFHYWNMNVFEIFRGSAPPSNRPLDPLMTSRSIEWCPELWLPDSIPTCMAVLSCNHPLHSLIE